MTSFQSRSASVEQGADLAGAERDRAQVGERLLEGLGGPRQLGACRAGRVAVEDQAEQRLLGVALRQHALAPGDVDDVQRRHQPRGLEPARQLLGLVAAAARPRRRARPARRRRARARRAAAPRPTRRDGVEQVAEGRLRQAPRERGDVGVDLPRRVVDLLGVRRRAAVEEAQRARLDEPLRQHAQLAGPVDGVGVVGRGDHLARDLADALVAVHRGGAQDSERFLLRDLARPHQDALGAIDELSLVEAARHLGELAAHAVLVLEARAGDVEHGAQPLGRVAVDDVRVDAGGQRTLDLRRLGVVGEHDDRAGRGLGEQRESGEQRLVGRDLVADDDVRRGAHRLAHQIVARRRGENANAGRRQVRGEVDVGRRRALDDQRGGHLGSRRRPGAVRSMRAAMQGAHHHPRRAALEP